MGMIKLSAEMVTGMTISVQIGSLRLSTRATGDDKVIETKPATKRPDLRRKFIFNVRELVMFWNVWLKKMLRRWN